MVDTAPQYWVPQQPMHHIFFDVDSTLTSIEGIDILAQWNQVGEEVAAITDLCMSKTGMNPKAYQQRLDMVKPTLIQIKQLSNLYIDKLTAGAIEVISVLQKLNKNVFIISAGLRQALLPLAKYLSIPPEHTYAVDIYFDNDGNYHHFDNSSPLAQKDGKTIVIQQVCTSENSAFLIGDGLSDLEARTAVERFVGFGGHRIRQTVLSNSDYYIYSSSLFSLLPLLLTAGEVERLDNNDYNHYTKGLADIHRNQVKIKESGNV